jgi:SAM-dependent methyltransferase
MAEISNWDDRYRSGDTPWDSGRPSEELRRVIAEAHITPTVAIEFGCGTGTNAVWLAQQGFQVTAVDVSPLALTRARQRAANSGVSVRFVEADVLQQDVLQQADELVGPFDFFFDRGCYHVVRRNNVQPYLDALRRLTHPGSVGLVLTGNAREPHDPGPPVVSEEQIRAELGSVFEITHMREFRFDTTDTIDVRFLAWSVLLRRGP